jgi:hypothetical protein
MARIDGPVWLSVHAWLTSIHVHRLAIFAQNVLLPHLFDQLDTVAIMISVDASSVAPGLEPDLAVPASEDVFLEVAHLQWTGRRALQLAWKACCA